MTNQTSPISPVVTAQQDLDRIIEKRRLQIDPAKGHAFDSLSFTEGRAQGLREAADMMAEEFRRLRTLLQNGSLTIDDLAA